MVKTLGALLCLEALFMLVPMFTALAYHEPDFEAWLVSTAITLFAGLLGLLIGRRAERKVAEREGYAIVALVWIVYSIFGMLPYWLSGAFPTFSDCWFETMSGFTTTGATIIDNVGALPHGILFWRSLTQWVGGLGIVFTVIAFIPSMAGSSGSIRVFGAEATGPFKAKLQPKLSTSVRFIWLVYLVISVWCFLSYMLFGMNWFEGINYAMSTAATGGYSIYNDSIEHFHSPGMEYTVQ